MAVNDDLADEAIMRSIRAMRAGNAIWKELLPILRRAERELVEKIEEIGGTRSFQSARAERMLREVRRIIDDGAEKFYARLETSGVTLAQAEATATAAAFAKHVPFEYDWTKPSARLLAAVAKERPFEGAILKDHMSKWSADTIFRMQGELRTALVQGETIEQMQRRLRGVAEIRTRDARTLATTYTAHVTNEGRAAIYEANSDVIASEMWTATLDDRTCFVAGTLVQTPEGKKAIEQLRAGDAIIGGSGAARTVLGTFKKTAKNLVKVRLSNGSVIVCTADHEFLSASGSWVEAGDMTRGQPLASHQEMRSLLRGV